MKQVWRSPSGVIATQRPGLISKVRDFLGPWTLADPPAFMTQSSGSDLSRLTLDWVTSCKSPDDEVKGSLKRIRARARDLERSNAYASNYLSLLADNVIGPNGMGHQAQVRNNDGNLNTYLNEKIEEAFADWAQAVSRDGKLSLVDLEQLALKTVARDGEAFPSLVFGPDYPYGMAIEMIDPDLVDETMQRPASTREAEIRMGVEVDEDGRPVAYYVFEDLYRNQSVPSYQRVRRDASTIIHLYRPKRVNQTRGVSWFLPVMIPLKMLDGYEEAELVAARVSSAKMGFFTSKGDNTSEFTEDSGEKAKQPLQMEANPGMAEQLPPGWGFEAWDPNHPNAAYAQFVKNTLRKVACGLSVSYNGLTSDLEAVNYSSMRSGLLIERDTWRSLQRWWIGAFRQKVYKAWLNSALLSGQLVLDSRDFRKFLSVKWNPRGWTWVDPQRDTAATILSIQNGLGSRTMALAEQGIDLEDVLEDLVEEKKLAERFGIEIDKGTLGAQQQGGDGKSAADKSDEQDKKDAEEANGNGNGKNRLDAILKGRF